MNALSGNAGIARVALLGSALLVIACSAPPTNAGSPIADGGGESAATAGDAQALESGAALPPDAGNGDSGGTVDAMTPTVAKYTLTITSPQPNASVSGAIHVAGEGPGFLNVEIHSMGGVLLARLTPDAAGSFSAPVDTTQLGNGAQTLTIDGWDAPAGGAYMHRATALLPLKVSNPTGDAGGPGCVSASGNGIRYFGAYTKNTQTNYDFNQWAGFSQDFLTSFINCDTWANMAASDWGFQIMQLQPPGENIAEIVCLSTTEDPLLAHVASGTYDSYLQQVGNLFIQYGYPKAFIRLGHEFDGTWYPWAINGGPNNLDYADFIAAFRHVATLLKAISPTFTIVWNPGCGSYAQQTVDVNAYPGDDVVDVVGVDCYDNGTGVDNIFNGAYGMNQWAQFAQQHGKPIALPEWGLMAGDDPAYIQAMYGFMTANPTFLEGFWDSDDGSTTSQLSTGEEPNSGAMFLQTIGQYAKACHP